MCGLLLCRFSWAAEAPCFFKDPLSPLFSSFLVSRVTLSRLALHGAFDPLCEGVSSLGMVGLEGAQPVASSRLYGGRPLPAYHLRFADPFLGRAREVVVALGGGGVAQSSTRRTSGIMRMWTAQGMRTTLRT